MSQNNENNNYDDGISSIFTDDDIKEIGDNHDIKLITSKHSKSHSLVNINKTIIKQNKNKP